MPRSDIFGCAGLELNASEKAFFADADPWGFILFARNIDTPDQIRRLTADLRHCVGREAPILIDQEGGRVARLLPPVWTEWQNALEFMDTLPSIAARREAMQLRYKVIGAELRDLGIDVNCAPMADIACDTTHVAIGQRCYGRTAGEVAVIGRAVADGLAEGGVLPILKHIPGHGRTPLDSHVDLPVVDAPRDVLMVEDFAPFKALADLPMAMTAHIIYSAIDSENCGTWSQDVVEVIRRDIGFDGLLMTDDLSMHALSGSFADRVAKSINAGCDMILHCNGNMDEMAAIASATPHLSDNSATRAEAALAARPEARPIDIPEALRRIAELGHEQER